VIEEIISYIVSNLPTLMLGGWGAFLSTYIIWKKRSRWVVEQEESELCFEKGDRQSLRILIPVTVTNNSDSPRTIKRINAHVPLYEGKLKDYVTTFLQPRIFSPTRFDINESKKIHLEFRVEVPDYRRYFFDEERQFEENKKNCGVRPVLTLTDNNDKIINISTFVAEKGFHDKLAGI